MKCVDATFFVSQVRHGLRWASWAARGNAFEFTAAQDKRGPMIHVSSGHLMAVDPCAGVLGADRAPYLVVASSRAAAHQVTPAGAGARLEDLSNTWNLHAFRIEDQRNRVGVLEVDRNARVTNDRAAAEARYSNRRGGAENEKPKARHRDGTRRPPP